MLIKDKIKNQLIHPVLKFLQQGVSPESLALAIAAGFVIGVFPVVGVTSVLCIIISVLLKLNVAVVLVVHYFVFPLQIILLIPYYRLGAFVFGIRKIIVEFHWQKLYLFDFLWQDFHLMLHLIIGALIVWFIFAVLSGIIIFRLSLYFLRNKLKSI
ncbi:MAG TPA: DUF2062 domain-containing protein [Bacteroidales bacterium]|nr:DUF2062 domain-containing protein [Bacteroidales bacterium]